MPLSLVVIWASACSGDPIVEENTCDTACPFAVDVESSADLTNLSIAVHSVAGTFSDECTIAQLAAGGRDSCTFSVPLGERVEVTHTLAGTYRTTWSGDCRSVSQSAPCRVLVDRAQRIDLSLQSCTPDCAGKDCGDDGCGGSCGDCESDVICMVGRCAARACPRDTSMASLWVVTSSESWTPPPIPEHDRLNITDPTHGWLGANVRLMEGDRQVARIYLLDPQFAEGRFLGVFYGDPETDINLCPSQPIGVGVGIESVYWWNARFGFFYQCDAGLRVEGCVNQSP